MYRHGEGEITSPTRSALIRGGVIYGRGYRGVTFNPCRGAGKHEHLIVCRMGGGWVEVSVRSGLNAERDKCRSD